MQQKIYWITFLLIGVHISVSQAQRIEEQTFELGSAQALDLHLKYASNIQLKNWNRSEVLVKATITINDNEDNDKYTLTSRSEGSTLMIESGIKDIKDIARKKTVLKDADGSGKTYWTNDSYWDKDNHVTVVNGRQVEIEIQYEISLPTQIPMKVKTVAGNILTDQTNQTLNLETISGEIDLSIAQNQKQTFALKTITGEVYTDLDLKAPNPAGESDLARVGGGFGKTVYRTLNGGGSEIKLKTISGNIYLRAME